MVIRQFEEITDEEFFTKMNRALDKIESNIQMAEEKRRKKWYCPEIKKKLTYDLDEIYRSTHTKARCENYFAERMDRTIREQPDCDKYHLVANVWRGGYPVDFIVYKDFGLTEIPGIIVEMDGSHHYWNGIDKDILRDFHILSAHPHDLRIYRIANSEFIGNWEYHTGRIIHWLNYWFGPDPDGNTKFSVPEEFYMKAGFTKHRVLNWPTNYHSFK